MAVSVNCGVFFVNPYIRALLFEVYIRAPDFFQTPVSWLARMHLPIDRELKFHLRSETGLQETENFDARTGSRFTGSSASVGRMSGAKDVQIPVHGAFVAPGCFSKVGCPCN